MGVQGEVYLLHIEPAYRHASHYLGWALDSTARFREHVAGSGSPLIRAALAAGREVTLVATWPGDRHLERKFKRQGGHGHRLCPRCRPAHLQRRRLRRQQRQTNPNQTPQEV